VRVWDLEGGKAPLVLKGHTGWVYAVALTADGCSALSGSEDNTVRVWDLEGGKAPFVLEGHTSWVYAVAVTADGRLAVSGSGDKTVRVWDLEGGEAPLVLEGHTSSVYAVALTADGRRAGFGSEGCTVGVWDLERGEEIATFIGENAMSSCAVSRDGRTIIAGDKSGRLHFLQLVEADKTKPLIGETKIQLLHREEPATDS